MNTDVCVLCCSVFYGKQKFFRCASCQKRAHIKCIQLPDEELQSLLTGEQPFKCGLCSCSALDAAGRPSIDSGEESQRLPPSSQPLLTQKSTPCLGDLEDSAGLQRMLLNALEGISFLTDEVAKLREGNERLCRDNARAFAQQADVIASLRAEVRSLRGELSRRAGSFLPVPSPPSTPMLNGTAAAASLRREPSSTFAGAVANTNGAVADTAPDQPMPGSTTSSPPPLLFPHPVRLLAPTR